MSPRLSICIPVYNGAEFLGETLESVARQLRGGIEVVVLDGGSTDGTRDVLEAYGRRVPELRFRSNPKRGGIDADMAECVSMALGDYCWLMSGDDTLREGAIDRVLHWIELGADVYVCEHSMCTRDMRWLADYPIMSPRQPLRVDFADRFARASWASRALNTEAFFSFMSALVVRRARWDEGSLPVAFAGSCWGHVARLFGLAEAGRLDAQYVPEVWLDKRGDNDSFADRGVVHRLGIAVEGYHRLGDHYFGHDSVEAFHMRRAVRADLGWRNFLYAKGATFARPDRESRDRLDRLVAANFGDEGLRNRAQALAYRLATPRSIRALRLAERTYKRLRGFARGD